MNFTTNATITLICLFFKINLISQVLDNIKIDENGRYNFKMPSKPDISKAKIGASSEDITIDVMQPVNDPKKSAEIIVNFSNNININNINFCYLSISYLSDDGTWFLQNSSFSKSFYFNSKAIDKINRKLTCKVTGLTEGKNYFVFFVPFYYSGQSNQVTTSFLKTPNLIQFNEKMLVVIDKEFENDVELNNALNEYKNDINGTQKHISFEDYYIQNSYLDKKALYNYIKNQYESPTTNFKYIFFIGRDASVLINRQYLDANTNNILYQYWDLSVAFYTQITNLEFKFDDLSQLVSTIAYRYASLNEPPIVDNANPIWQSYDNDLLFSTLIPPNQETKRDFILNYFRKLHKYKTGQISFNKKVLFADNMRNDAPSQIINTLSTRWNNNDTINVAQKFEFGINNSGTYPAWTSDYLNKLSNNSYEICSFNGHGNPVSHYFGIESNTMSSLVGGNTMFFDLYSCAVGNFNYLNYLSSQYLNFGNTLFVKSFTENVGIVSTLPYSNLIIQLYPTGTYTQLLNNNISQSIFNSSNYLSINLNLGDPLLRLDPCSSIYSVKSGDWDDPSVWSCGNIPTSNQIVYISENNVILVSSGNPTVKSLINSGELRFNENSTLTISSQ